MTDRGPPKKKAGPPKGKSNNPSGGRKALALVILEMMQAMLHARAADPTPVPNLSALEFLRVVVNGDARAMLELGFEKFPSMEQRQAAAIALLPYTEQRQPVKVIHEHNDPVWSQKMIEAQNRLQQLRRPPPKEGGAHGKTKKPITIDA